MKKSKFANINFESLDLLSREQMSKVKGGYHRPNGISQTWCNNLWTTPCGPACVSTNTAGYEACMRTCQTCNNNIPC